MDSTTQRQQQRQQPAQINTIVNTTMNIANADGGGKRRNAPMILILVLAFLSICSIIKSERRVILQGSRLHDIPLHFYLMGESSATATASATSKRSAVTTPEQDDSVYIPSEHVKPIGNNHSFLWNHGDGARPPLKTFVTLKRGHLYVQKEQAQQLLDFAVIGHGKCGTTTLQRWLEEHPECRVLKNEAPQMFMGSAPEMVKKLYTELGKGPELKRGYKYPQDIRSPMSLRLLRYYFPKTLLIVGIRHPVLWFESFYNFKVQNQVPHMTTLAHPNTYINQCTDLEKTYLDISCLGTGKGRFHLHLAMLKKATRTLGVEHQIPGFDKLPSIPNPLFLVEVSQLSDADPHRSQQIRRDLQHMLGLKAEFPAAPVISPGKQWNNTQLQTQKAAAKMDICQDQYQELRTHLMELSRNVSTWILSSGFLDHPTVMVSSRDHFERILGTDWRQDPCEGPRKKG